MREKLTTPQWEILQAAAEPGAVIWPRVCEGVRQYAKTSDGRLHFMAPVDDAFEVFEMMFIDSHGSITPAGRAALQKDKGNG
jgi:hypothetical protein